MRHGHLTEGACPNDGKNIAPRLRPPLKRQQRAKSRLRRDRGFETAQKPGAILENSRLIDSSKAAKCRPLNGGSQENEGHGRVLADESSQVAAIRGD